MSGAWMLRKFGLAAIHEFKVPCGLRLTSAGNGSLLERR